LIICGIYGFTPTFRRIRFDNLRNLWFYTYIPQNKI
jgi:hypothetical protein